MQDVSDKLLGQFVGCLEQRLGQSGGPAPADAGETPGPAETAETPTDASGTAPVAEASAPTAPSAPATPPPAATPRPASATRGSDEALDVGKTVLPVLAKAYWKQAVVALIVIIVIIWLIAR
jgi:uncharacterized protein